MIVCNWKQTEMEFDDHSTALPHSAKTTLLMGICILAKKGPFHGTVSRYALNWSGRLNIVIGVFQGGEWYVVLPFAFSGAIPFILVEIIGVGK